MADLQARAITSTQLTIDDFDPLFSYSDYTAWQTPNPQDNPTWWNESSQVTGSVWHQATYHYTDQVGQKVSLEFKGASLPYFTSPSLSHVLFGSFISYPLLLIVHCVAPDIHHPLSQLSTSTLPSLPQSQIGILCKAQSALADSFRLRNLILRRRRTSRHKLPNHSRLSSPQSTRKGIHHAQCHRR